MRYESSITSLSWIPSEAVTGSTQGGLRRGIEPLRRPAARRNSTTSRPSGTADRFRFANMLRAWIEVGRLRCGHRRRLQRRGHDGRHHRPRWAACGTASRRSSCPKSSGRRSTATAGCGSSRPSAAGPALPTPRRVQHRPFVQWQAPLVWTTLTLTLHADGTAELAMTGASPFPRHWVYGDRRAAHPQVGPDRLRGLVPQVVRQAQPVGRRGLSGAGHGGRDRPGAGRCPCSSCTARPSR